MRRNCSVKSLGSKQSLAGLSDTIEFGQELGLFFELDGGAKLALTVWPCWSFVPQRLF